MKDTCHVYHNPTKDSSKWNSVYYEPWWTIFLDPSEERQHKNVHYKVLKLQNILMDIFLCFKLKMYKPVMTGNLAHVWIVNLDICVDLLDS